METSFIITFISDDRPGLVEEVSSVISAHGGNWLESRLSQLAGKFAGLIKVSLPADQADALEVALNALADKGLSMRVHAATGDIATASGRGVKLIIMGPDRPGIIREIAAALAAQKINVEDLESSVDSAPMSAEQLFTATVEARIDTSSNLEDLAESLDAIANEMSVDIALEYAES